MDRKNFIDKFNTYFEKNDSIFFHFNVEVKEYANNLEFNENLHQLFIPFFESIEIKNKYQILDKINNHKNYDVYYEEDNPDSEFCSFKCEININELYDIIKKVEKYPVETVEVYRIETNDNRGLYDTFFAALPVDEIHHPNPRLDTNFLGIFDNYNNDYNYMNKWSFGFANVEDIKNWLLTEENQQKLQTIGGTIKQITIDKNYVIYGNKQLIFKKEEKIAENVIDWKLLPQYQSTDIKIDINHYKTMKPYDVQMIVYEACEKGDINLVKQFLENEELNVDINCFQGCFLTKSIKHGHLELVKYLLTSKSLKENISIEVGEGEPLKEACEHAQLEIIKYLLTSPELKQHADIYTNQNNAFRMACEKQHIEIIDYFLTSPDLQEKFNIEQHLFTPMVIAGAKDNVEMVKILIDNPKLEKKIDINQHEDIILNAIYDGAVNVMNYFIFEKNVENTFLVQDMLKNKPNELIEKWFAAKDLKNKLENKFQAKHTKSKAIKI